jgi:hypothetical protein
MMMAFENDEERESCRERERETMMNRGLFNCDSVLVE